MPDSHYKFDPESLSYDKIETSRRQKVVRIITQVIAGFVIAVILFVVFSYFFETPKQKTLRRENRELNKQYEVLQDRYSQTEKVLQDVKQRDENIYKSIFESEPPRNTSLEDKDPYQQFEGLDNSELVEESTLRLQKISKQLYFQSKTYQELLQIVESKKGILSSIPSIQPLPNYDLQFLPYGFGKRIDPVYKTPAFHYGMDFAAPRGTDVYTTADGTITKVDENARAYGKVVKINHGNGYETLYAHLSDISVSVGKKVKRGDVIGTVGSTGKAFVPHLHYEVFVNGKQVNPVHFFFQELTPQKYHKMYELSARGGLSLD